MSHIQSVVFPKYLWTAQEAREWLTKHYLLSDDFDEKPDTYRFRQIDPDYFAYMRIKMVMGTNPRTKEKMPISFIIGF
jgi:hypothetical protein